jgi:ribosome assembly protein 4
MPGATALGMKRKKVVRDDGSSEDEAMSSAINPNDVPESVIIQLQNLEDGKKTGPQLDVPTSSSVDQMEKLLNQLLKKDANDTNPYAFYVDIGDGKEAEVTHSLRETIAEFNISTETVITVRYQPLAVFRVRPVTRCTDTMQGHSEAILHCSFSPNGKILASGGGDTTVRFWDTNTCLPKHVCRGHKHWVLCTAWSPDGERFASADKNGEIRMWQPSTGQPVGAAMRGHTKHITSLSWEPMHVNKECERMASASKDHTCKVWNTRLGRVVCTLSGHTNSVECVKWGGEGLIYTSSQDRTIKVWAIDENVGGNAGGKLVRTLSGHGHRVNHMAFR